MVYPLWFQGRLVYLLMTYPTCSCPWCSQTKETRRGCPDFSTKSKTTLHILFYAPKLRQTDFSHYLAWLDGHWRSFTEFLQIVTYENMQRHEQPTTICATYTLYVHILNVHYILVIERYMLQWSVTFLQCIVCSPRDHIQRTCHCIVWAIQVNVRWPKRWQKP